MFTLKLNSKKHIEAATADIINRKSIVKDCKLLTIKLVLLTLHCNLHAVCVFDFFSFCVVFADSSSISSTNSNGGGANSSLWGGDLYLGLPYPSKPCTSSPALHVHSNSDLEILGHHRRGSSGDKNKVQISAELKHELASRWLQQKGASYKHTHTHTHW